MRQNYLVVEVALTLDSRPNIVGGHLSVGLAGTITFLTAGEKVVGLLSAKVLPGLDGALVAVLNLLGAEEFVVDDGAADGLAVLSIVRRTKHV